MTVLEFMNKMQDMIDTNCAIADMEMLMQDNLGNIRGVYDINIAKDNDFADDDTAIIIS